MIRHMSSSINVNRICRNVKGRYGVLEHGGMLPKDVPILLAYSVSAFAASDGSKFKGTMDICIGVCNVEPFPKRQEVMACCIFVGCVGWTNKVCVCGEQRMKTVLTTVKLNPITQVDCIVAPVGRMENVKIKQESAVQHARWVDRNRITERKPCEAPFPSVISTNTVSHEKQTIRALDDGCCDQVDGRELEAVLLLKLVVWQ